MSKFNQFVLALGILCILIVGYQLYDVSRAVEALQYRARVSADAEKMAQRLDDLLKEMEIHGLTHGYAAIIFKSPANDVGLDYEALRDLRDRAQAIAQLEKNSTAYQTGLEDLRGTLREIELDAQWFVFIRSWIAWLGEVVWIYLIVKATLWGSKH